MIEPEKLSVGCIFDTSSFKNIVLKYCMQTFSLMHSSPFQQGIYTSNLIHREILQQGELFSFLLSLITFSEKEYFGVLHVLFLKSTSDKQ